MKRKTIHFIMVIMCAMHVLGCSRNDSIISVAAPEFEKEIKSGSVQLLDVRTPEEFADGHIADAINIDVKEEDFQEMASEKLSKDSTVLVYCRSGRRSLDAAGQLTKLGYKVVNLTGGITEWKENGLPVTDSVRR
ncbi:MAG: rhodanese-like domain-containing protein [Paramuribaculum sp.]|nr:rhodanese-like domain-containing protein [Paramuribaculum sp.]